MIISCSLYKKSHDIKVSKNNFDTLYPLFNKENFITIKNGKWGVIDSKGNKVLPFIYDGIKAISDSIGVATIYSGSYSLHTGIPRYVYCGKYFVFSKKGLLNNNEKEFNVTIVGVADSHNKEFVVDSPYRYVPSDTINNKSCQETKPFYYKMNN